MLVLTVLSIGTAFFVLTGLLALAQPARFAHPLGLALSGADGLNEVRAQYGGQFLLAGLVLGASLLGQLPHEWALIVMATIFGGVIAGRLIGLAAQGSFSAYGVPIRTLFVVDAVGTTLAIAGLLKQIGAI